MSLIKANTRFIPIIRDVIAVYGLTMELKKTEWVSFNKREKSNYRSNQKVQKLGTQLDIESLYIQSALPCGSEWDFDELMMWNTHRAHSREEMRYAIRVGFKNAFLHLHSDLSMDVSSFNSTRKEYCRKWNTFLRNAGCTASGLLRSTPT